MKPMLAILAITATLVCGCTPRPINPATERLYSPYEIAITRRAFDAKYPMLARRHAPLTVPGVVGGRTYGLEQIESGGFRSDGPETFGCYDHKSRVCYFVCADINHPTPREWVYLWHERCHRIEAIEGWDAAAPEWRRLSYAAPWAMTHPDVNRRLEVQPIQDARGVFGATTSTNGEEP